MFHLYLKSTCLINVLEVIFIPNTHKSTFYLAQFTTLFTSVPHPLPLISSNAGLLSKSKDSRTYLDFCILLNKSFSQYLKLLTQLITRT